MDINVGRATIKARELGGWALPGQGITFDPKTALEAANRVAGLFETPTAPVSVLLRRRVASSTPTPLPWPSA